MKSRHALLCAIYGALILGLSFTLVLSPKRSYSPIENRMLATFPSLSIESVADKSFAKGVSTFCADHMPLREWLISLDTEVDLMLGKLESRGVMLGKNQNLIKRLEYESFDKLAYNLSQIEDLKNIAENGFVFACAPRGVDVLRDFCPSFFDGEQCDKAFEYLSEADIFTKVLRQKADEGEYVFYKTDHHWTTLGAYYAYLILAERLGYAPLHLSEFKEESVCDDFLGTTYSSILLPNASPDKITAYRCENEPKVTDLSTGKRLSLYDESALEKSSKYDFFLGGNRALLRVEGEGKPRLTVIKDSFANSLIPFLSLHYELDVIDPRYIKKPIAHVIAELWENEGASPLLVIFGVDTLCKENLFS